jgi:hypothetical protein
MLSRIGKCAHAEGALGNGQAGALRFGRGKWGMNVAGIDNRQLVLGIERWLLAAQSQ